MGTKKETKIGKVIWVIGSLALSIAGFAIVPKVQGKLADKIYMTRK